MLRGRYKKIALLTGLWLCIPFFMIQVMQGVSIAKLHKKNVIEDCLPFIVAACCQESFHKEVLCAMAIISRTNYTYMLEQKQITPKQLKDTYGYVNRKQYLEDKDYYRKIYEACKETEGMVLSYQNESIYCPYFFSCGGVTRDGFTYFQENSFPYLIPVPSYRDEESDGYISYHYFQITDFYDSKEVAGTELEEPECLQILEKDKAGYVLWIKAGGDIMGGEVFCEAYHLPSACFDVEQQGEQIRIICKGNGHGFGFSKFGGNQMAKDGYSYQRILKHYFPELQLEM